MSAHIIRDFIKTTLKERNLSPMELSKMSGVGNSSIYDLLQKNQNKMDIGNIIRFANALGCTLETMLGKDSTSSNTPAIIPLEPEEAMAHLLSNLKTILKNKHMNIKTLTSLCRTNSQAIYSFHSGNSKTLSLEIISDIGDIFGYSIDQLIGRQAISIEKPTPSTLKGLSKTDKEVVENIRADLAKAMQSNSNKSPAVVPSKNKTPLNR